MIKLVATDLDGTLVHDRKMHKKDRAALMEVLSKGIPVVPVTTRMRYSSSEMLVDVPIYRSPLVCMNGAYVIGPGWDDEIHKEWFKKTHDIDTARAISSYTDEKGYEMTTIFGEKKFWKTRDGQRPGPHPSDSITHLVERNQDALEFGEPISFMMHDDRNGKEGLKDIENFAKVNFKNKVTVHRHHRMGDWVALTIYPPRTNKLNGLKIVCKKMNISLDDVLAIGDDLVDKEMIEASGIGVAMGDSPDEVRSVADDLAPSCTEQGFSWALNKHVI